MDFKARVRFARISPKKVRPLARLLAGMSLNQALTALKMEKRRAATMLHKLVKAAWGSAQEKDAALDEDDFFVKTAFADEGPSVKRLRPRSMGRANLIKKRSSHITVVLSDGQDAED